MATTTVRTEDQILAAVAAGHEMAGMPLTDDDVAALRRLSRGESTVEQERERVLTELAAGRPGHEPDAPSSQPSGLDTPGPMKRDLP